MNWKAAQKAINEEQNKFFEAGFIIEDKYRLELKRALCQRDEEWEAARKKNDERARYVKQNYAAHTPEGDNKFAQMQVEFDQEWKAAELKYADLQREYSEENKQKATEQGRQNYEKKVKEIKAKLDPHYYSKRKEGASKRVELEAMIKLLQTKLERPKSLTEKEEKEAEKDKKLARG
ncbi:unnamed protein product [Amoebophrya sp. A25]|nr:unnamed protein product [Amoebophrya sp. A25]|eukprot:GSA25T00022815001.1